MKILLFWLMLLAGAISEALCQSSYNFINASNRQIVLEERFNDNRNDWQIETMATGGINFIENGFYKLRSAPKLSRYAQMKNPLVLSDNFEIESAIRLFDTLRPNGMSSVILGASGGHHVLFGVTNNGYGKIQILENDQYWNVTVWKKIPGGFDRSALNKFTIRRINGVVYFFINEKLLDLAYNVQFSGFWLGFQTRVDGAMEVDYVRVSNLTGILSDKETRYNPTQIYSMQEIKFEAFDNNENKWLLGPDDSGIITIDDGMMKMQATSQTSALLVWNDFNLESVSDYEIETQIKIETIGSYGCGLVFGYRSQNHLALLVDPSGSCFVDKIENNTHEKVTPLKQIPMFKQGDFNKLSVRKIGDLVYYYINEILVDVTRFPLFGSYVGLYLDRDYIALIDYIRVSEIKKVTSPQASPKPETVVTPPAVKGNFHAIIIGTSEYNDENISDLQNPVKEAERFYNLLTSKYTFDKSRTRLLKNPTRLNITDAFDTYTNTLTDEDRLLIFYSGHGIWDEDTKMGYWMVSDSRIRSRGSYVSNNEIKNYIKSIKSKHVLLITDACFAGAIFKSDGAMSSDNAISTEPSANASVKTKLLAKRDKLACKRALTSGALQYVPDESVFMRYLTKQLSESTDQYLFASDLYSKLKDVVTANSPSYQLPQFDRIHEAGDEGGDFVFIKRY